MLHASLTVDPAFRVADVNPRTFGSFVEHMGRCVYTGIYEPGHRYADEDGLRRDVLDLVRELGVTTVRYPGGNFVSGFRWEDSVGPVEQRPTRLDLAWHSTETNAFGLHEFHRWAQQAGVEPMMAVNLGTRGVAEALDLLEYCNHPEGTALSERRRANGAKEPFGIRMWCLGNEMDGPWQTGHKTAAEYGRLAAETARAMRMIDPKLELVACGSSSSSMPTFGSWEATVLEEAYDQVDYISCHAYYEELDGDLGSFLASGADMDHFVESVVATADHVRAKLRQKKRINLSFDEWNVWYNTRFEAQEKPSGWAVAPRVIEDEYNVADAVVVGGLLISLLRNSDRVTAACLAQLVNVIAPIRSEPGGPSWRQTTFHPFAQVARHARGTVLRVAPVAPVYETKRFGEVPVVDAVATHIAAADGADELTVFAVNRHQSENVELALDLRAFSGYTPVEHSVLGDPDIRATNTQDDPDRVRPHAAGTASVTDGRLAVHLPAVSWNVIRLRRVG
ncbi:alpha-N-arabinofuranosidase [Streptomyces sp. TRM68367]|uniref:arabinosylfuranosidase ArfA n=1 Tax=Streptomyces sp. TRM68367 TaxID=2758415 RepID=UPI00165B8483|nr:alpha-N-arabinofuranosidase [Streptomyces sp. TRM68367]MBC9730067.1 alpha-N-arabinofuranosidase [Streptomyces sp. TRM68367]